MKINANILASGTILISLVAGGCTSTADNQISPHDQLGMNMGNSENVNVINNRVVMLHDLSVTRTTDGAELEGKVHYKGHQDYVPGHIDIAVIDKKTGDTTLVVTTDFNSRIARHGRYNLRHPNNMGTRLPGIDPDKSTIFVAYHYSNVDRFSKIDCGSNVALAAIDEKTK